MKHQTITCPCCKVKQTGIVRISRGTVTLIPSESHSVKEDSYTIKEGTPYIRCCLAKCQYLIVGEELNDVLTPIVKFPSEIKEAREEVLV